MKKATLLIPILLLLVVTHSYAQTGVQLGVAAGAAFTTVTGDDVEDASSRTSAFFGGSLVWHPAASRIGFETGVLYVPKGAETTVEGGSGTLKLTYIEVPLMLRLGLGSEGAKIKPVVAVGASLGFKSGCKIEGASGSTSLEMDCDDPAFGGELDVKSMDIGATAGLSADIAMGTRGVLAPFVRYTKGLSTIDDTSAESDVKNSAFQVGAAFRIMM